VAPETPGRRGAREASAGQMRAYVREEIVQIIPAHFGWFAYGREEGGRSLNDIVTRIQTNSDKETST